jgi:hypothetical protein
MFGFETLRRRTERVRLRIDARTTAALRQAALCAGLLLCTVQGAAAAGEAERWQALFAAVPALPATPLEASQKISARTVQSEGLGITQLRIEVADAGLRALQQQVDQLFAPTSQTVARQIRRNMEAAEKDPALAEMARRIDQAWQPDPAHPDKPPTLEEMRRFNREIEAVLGPMSAAASAAPAPRSEIAAYRLELQRATPRAGQFMQRLSDQQRQYARQHAQADREAIAQLNGANVPATARALLARHDALAQQQLADATAILQEARETLAPRVKRMAELARAAEQRDAPPGERNNAYAVLKSYVEFLLTLQRETLQDVGFWGGIRVAAALPAPAQAGTRSLYAHALAPGFELRANGELPLSLPYYPIGRAIVVGLEPGIR